MTYSFILADMAASDVDLVNGLLGAFLLIYFR